MKLGDVVKKERLRRGLSADAAAEALGLSPAAYEELEAGRSSAEVWGPLLARVAVALALPTSRLLAPSGRATDVVPDQAPRSLIEGRERRDLSPGELARMLDLPLHEYERIEAGATPILEVGRQLLRFAELIEQPVFNLLYPCGLPLDRLDNYP